MKHIFSSSFNQRKSAGFTLIELMITVAIIGILAAVAVPAYSDYVIRGKIPEATSALASMRIRLEQFYQDARNYGSDDANCGVPNPASDNFTYTCNWSVGGGVGGTNQFYLITATGIAGRGMNGFAYTIDQAGNRRTTAVPNAAWGTAPIACWVVKKGGGC
ncbi:type IV pilin protein [Herminiimonas fonticola]|uniref:Type IV pilus assembly protein PilE n=1 Tax=Herminiimonas fonticola TaxID=303380 RepID=A0A4R6GGE8_9BURK|nr:prepilin-type N-terminal cleavage/methylation domain-containing protein [Herminiimonas fonticola]RBA24852.1 prepilin-type N-terminal cleavage/methylation domain [Herminiimonas fonticola]TDN93966.1 type IV pilus assembly protein PilE [Herminiimonas fonticola]